MLAPTVADIFRAHATVRGHAFRTPLRHSWSLSEMSGVPTWLKLECWQPTGSFKVRGALNFLANLTVAERAHPLVTASAGNHALGVSYAAQQLGMTGVTIFVPRTAPRAKLDKLRAFPVEVIQAGDTYDEAHHAAEQFQRDTGATFVHAYDDPRTVAGAGTIGLEILEDLPDVEVVLVPVGGGGMIAGIATAIKAVAPAVKVIGVQPEASPALRDSLRDGRVYEEYPAGPTIADGLAGGIGRICFEVAQRCVDDVIIVREDELHAAVAALVAREQLLVEGSGAVGVAAVMLHAIEGLAGKRTAAVLSGANLDPETLSLCLRTLAP